MKNLNNKIVASIEARMTSKRLPGKVLMEAINGISMLEFMINRIKKSKKIHQIVVATTTNKSDDPIIELCKKLKIDFYRGSEEDVLERVYKTHSYFKSNIVVELTGDCPLIDSKIIDDCIDLFLKNKFDYVSNAHIRSYPDGFDTQVFSFQLLKKINSLADSDYDRENVTSFIYKDDQKNNFKLKAIIADENNFWPELRVTLDDYGDYKLIKAIIKNLYPKRGFDFECFEVINFLKSNTKLMDFLKDVRKSHNPYQKTSKKIEKKV